MAFGHWLAKESLSVIMGFVGAGGLGQMLYYHLSIFQQAQAATVLIAIFVPALAVVLRQWHTKIA